MLNLALQQDHLRNRALPWYQVFGPAIWTEAAQALLSWDVVQRERQAGYPVQRQALVWHSLLGVLAASANVSRMFWSPGGDRERCDALRLMFDVRETSPIKSRALRNHFEHFDERLDDWCERLSKEGSLSIVDRFIGPPRPDAGRFEVLRYLDGDELTFEYLGEIVELEPLVAELRRIHDVARDAQPPLAP